MTRKNLFGLLLFLSAFFIQENLNAQANVFIQNNDLPPVLVSEILVDKDSSNSYLELLVIGSNDDKEFVDLEGWMIDNDSPSTFANQGYIKFGKCFSEVPAGTVIVIYEDNSSNTIIHSGENGTPNLDGVYQIPFSSNCLEKINYNTGKSNDKNQESWSNFLQLDSSSDALQIRNSENNLVSAISWKKDNFSGYEDKGTFNTTVEGNGSFFLTTQNQGCYTTVFQSEKKDDQTPGVTTISIVSTINIQCGINQPATNGNDGIIEVTFDGGTAPYTIEWSGASSGSMTINAVVVGDNHLIENLPHGYYTITVTDAEGCENTCSVQLSHQEESTVCEEECTTIGPDNPNPEYCYYWEPTNEFEDPTLPQQEVCPKESMTYTLTVTDMNGDVVEVLEEVVNVSKIDLNVTPNPATICDNNPVNLDAGNGYASYSWKDENGIEVGTQQVFQTTQAGKYTVEVTNDDGCSAIEEVDVINASDPENIRQFLADQGFEQYPITVDGDLPTFSPDDVQTHIAMTNNFSTEFVDDCALRQISVPNDPVPWHLGKIIDSDIELAVQDGYSGRGKVIDFAGICNNVGCDLEELFAIDEFDCSIQAYIYDDPQSSDDYLMLKFNTVSLDAQIEKSSTVEVSPTEYLLIYDESDSELLVEPCTISEPTINYQVDKVGDDYYGFTCSGGEWQQGDITQIEKGNVLNGTDNLYNDFPPVSVETFLGLRIRGNPSLKAYNLATSDFYPTHKSPFLENTFRTNFKTGTIHLLSEKEEILDHYTEGFTAPPYNTPPGLGSHNVPLIWEKGTEMSHKMFYTVDFEKTIRQVNERITSWLKENEGSLNGLFTDIANFDVDNGYPVTNANLNSFVWPKQIFGGTQAIGIYVTNIDTKIISEDITDSDVEKHILTEVNVTIEVIDTFGAGHEDGARWHLPGLVEMYILQHFRNDDTSSSNCDEAPCYVPFTHRVLVPYRFFYSATYK